VNPIRHILTGSDLSEASMDALERGYLLAKEHQARLSVLYALGLDPLTSLRELLGQDTDEVSERISRRENERLAASLTDLNIAHNVSAEAFVEEGRPSPALLSFAEQHECDVLLLGKHGSSALPRMIVGSTTSRALRQSNIPVLVVKNKPHDGYRRVLIAVDFSPASETLIRMSQEIAPDAHITLLHVCSDAMEAQMRYASVSETVVARYRASAEQRATIRLDQLALDCGLQTDTFMGLVVHGIPIHKVIEVEKEVKPDLIMLGKHGRHTAEELILGSVTKRAVEMTQADVLVMVNKQRPTVISTR
jgi:nucleotide-binding universal stress UspA family protein